jgi:hypothetical protein
MKRTAAPIQRTAAPIQRIAAPIQRTAAHHAAPHRSTAPRLFLALSFLLFLGCRQKIGDACVTDIDCSQAGDRTCDTTQPNGYCTQVDCDPFSCPEKESICIAFNDVPSNVGACNLRGQTSPYRRTFCMESCKDVDDCRGGYACMDMTDHNPWGAEVIQDDPKRTTVCVLAMTFEQIEDDRQDQVCTGGDASIGGAGGMGGGSAD